VKQFTAARCRLGDNRFMTYWRSFMNLHRSRRAAFLAWAAFLVLCPLAAEAEPAADAALPPIESIVAGSDISAFLAPGVPEEVKLAALRRAWRVDPMIRDFVGVSENSWDMSPPSSDRVEPESQISHAGLIEGVGH
jgi:hypothetical protein